jgi:hypothetical protein
MLTSSEISWLKQNKAAAAEKLRAIFSGMKREKAA